jgi:arylsulfatase A-like enzyme
VNAGERRLSASEREHLISQYDGGIAAEDLAIGQLIDKLKELGMYDNSLIIITADHGDSMGEHGFLEHALGTVYQTQVHVPLLIKYPGQHEATKSDILASQVDLMPTVLEAAGIAPPSRMIAGQSLLSPTHSDAAFIETRPLDWATPKHNNPYLNGIRRAIVAGSFKLIDWSNGPPELYDLSVDPTEEHNLYRPDEPHATELQARLNAWISTLPKAPLTSQKKPDSQTLERLKSLGYVQ